MVQLFIDGGGFMWPILFIFIIGLVFVLERLYHLLRGLSSNEEFALEVANTVSNQGIDAAKKLFRKSSNPRYSPDSSWSPFTLNTAFS